MRLNKKINRISLIMAMVLAVLLSIVVTYLVQNYAEQQAREEGRIVVAMATVGLLHSMLEVSDGKFNRSDIRNEINDMFKAFASIPQLIEMRSLRGKSVVDQYGIDEKEGVIEDIERIMLDSGEPSEVIQINEDGIKVFHYNGPLKAEQKCLECHNATEGEVLGGLSVQVDITAAEAAARQAVYQVIFLLILVGVLFVCAIRKTLIPMVKTVQGMTGMFEDAIHGKFTRRIQYEGDDEIAEVAFSANRLMSSLDRYVGAIEKDVEDLTGRVLHGEDSEPMAYMASVVHNLTAAVRFKEEIEADRHLDEVYTHFGRMLKKRFDIHRFALYEISSSRKTNKTVLSEGMPDGIDGWCEVSNDPDECRAKRTVRIVDSSKDAKICAQFCGNCKNMDEQLRHVCLPVLNSEGDGVTLQVVFNAEQSDEMEKKTMLLQYYLRVAAPEIETKRLTRRLRETTLRDALTGMYNRRFLDEFTANLESSVDRSRSSLGVMMCDIDYFKKVNDERGHASGDMVLAEVAGFFHEIVRGNDLVIRYGGEEMLVILMDSNAEHATEVAERIRKRIETHTMNDESGSFSITISIGVNMYDGEHGSLRSAIQQADEALYKAKDSGRNRVVCFDKTEVDN